MKSFLTSHVYCKARLRILVHPKNSVKYIDIHTHIQHSADNVIAIRNLLLSEAEKMIASEAQGFFSAGVHPWDSETVENTWIEQLRKVSEDDRIVLIGECGLDKNIEASSEKQTELFSEHIQLSESLKKPLIIHCVGRFNELIELKKKYNPTQQWIIHGFRGKPQLAGQLLNVGFYLSYGEKFNPDSVQATPVERLFLETDEGSQPIDKIYEQIAAIKGCRMEDLSAGKILLKID